MSYILDALKKSEQERGHGGIPSVQTIHSSSLVYNNKKTYWPYILIVAVLLNLAAILYFVIDKDKPVENSTTSETPAAENSTVLLTTQKNTQASVTTAPVKQPVDTATATVRNTAEEINDITPAPQPVKVEPAAAPVAHSNAGNDSTLSTASTNSSASVDNTNVIEFHELPEAIKQKLPAIIISAHVYSSNPLQRSIVINNNFMEEGEYFLDDMVLHEITADGAIFYYKDIKFHLGVVSGWQ